MRSTREQPSRAPRAPRRHGRDQLRDGEGVAARSRRCEARLVERFDAASDGILIHRDLEYLYANDAALVLLGRTRGEVVGHTALEVVAPRCRAALADRITSAWHARSSIPEEDERLLHSVGTDVPVEVAAVPVVFRGELATLVHIRDCSARRELEIGLRAADRLASAGLVAAGVAHEIDQPLRCARAAIEELKRKIHDGAADAAGALAVVERAVERASDAARHARVFSSRQRAARTRLDVHEVLDACVLFLGPDLRSRVNLTKQYGDVPPVLGRAPRLAHVFMNLLTNAVQAMSDRPRCPADVIVRTSAPSGAQVVVEIEDTGVGLSPQLRRAFCEPLCMARARGMGMGLSLCRALVDDEGGTLGVDSAPGVGTTVRVSLPAAPPEPEEETEVTKERSCGRRILVVEDDPRLVATLRFVLGSHRTDIVRSGAEALELLRAARGYDLVVCDLSIEDVDAIDLRRRILARWPELELRMIFLTGDPFISLTQELLASIPCPQLRKPFEPEDLLDLVDDVLGASSWRDAHMRRMRT